MKITAILFVVLPFALYSPQEGYSQSVYSVTPDGKKHPAGSVMVSSSKEKPEEDIDYMRLLKKIKVGKTNKLEVIKLLGTPRSSQTYSESGNKGWEPQGTMLLYEGRDMNGQKINIKIIFNKEDIVYKKETGPLSQGTGFQLPPRPAPTRSGPPRTSN